MENRIGEVHLSKEGQKLTIIKLGTTNKTGNKTYYVQYENGELSPASYVYYEIKNNKVTSNPRRRFKNKNHPLYSRWKAMMERCYKENSRNYKFYGDKGVTVCERWHDFDNFVEDVDKRMLNGHLLYEKGWQLDKDIKSGMIYSLENSIVIPAKENREFAYEKQQREILAIIENEEIRFKSISEASRQLDIPRNTIQLNLKKERVHSSGYSFKYIN